MTNPKSRIFAAVAGALSMGAAAAWAQTPTQQDVQIQQLQARLASLEAKQAANSKDMAATIDAVLRDAEKRSALLATSGDMGAGYDYGFYIRAGDAWVLRPGVQFQFRHIANFRKDVVGSGDDIENGFEVSRLSFELGGTAFTKDLEYYFNWNTDTNDGTLALEDAWAKYMFADEWGTRAGQFKVPAFHEWNVSEKRQLAVDRSLANELIAGGVVDRTQGVTLIYGNYGKNNPVNVEAGLTDGLNEDNTSFVDKTFNWGLTGRVEFKAMGSWDGYRDFSAMGNKEDMLVFGLGGDWSQAGDGNVLHGTVDAQYENAAGLGVFGAFLVQWADKEFTGVDDITNWGVVLQAGYMLNPAWELFGRYDVTVFDENQVSDEDTFHEITVGLNYFLGTNGSAGHRAKITVDLSYLPNGSPRAVEKIGILDSNDASDEWMLRAQFQLLI